MVKSILKKEVLILTHDDGVMEFWDAGHLVRLDYVRPPEGPVVEEFSPAEKNTTGQLFREYQKSKLPITIGFDSVQQALDNLTKNAKVNW